MTKSSGFTVLELLIAVSIFSLVSVASVGMVFFGLGLRDQTLAATRVQEQLRVFSHTLRTAILGARVISGDEKSLLITASNTCWSFVYDSVQKNVLYSQAIGADCVPDPAPQTLFFSTSAEMSEFSFLILPLPTGGRQVSVSGKIEAVLPLNDYEVDFSDTFTNLVD